MKFQFLPHTADIKFQAFGKTLEECFKNSAFALTNIICKEKVKEKVGKKIRVEGKDRESLLYNFLEEFLFLLDAEDLILSEIKNLRITKEKEEKLKLEAEIYCDNVGNYKCETDVKAITYNEMFVKEQNIKGKKRFVSQVVVDV